MVGKVTLLSVPFTEYSMVLIVYRLGKPHSVKVVKKVQVIVALKRQGCEVIILVE